MSTAIKICGLTRHSDARAAAAAGAQYLGVVFASSSPRRQDRAGAKRVWDGLSTPRVGVFVDPSPTAARALAAELGLAVIQLHGSEAPELCAALRGEGAEGPKVWKTIRAKAPTDVAEALDAYRGRVDGLLVEGWSAAGLGGVGARFDWSWLRGRRADWPSGLALILAGGLDADCVGAAIAEVEPDVVDVSSGVERSPGVKDPEAVRAFVGAARGSGRT